MRYAFYAFSDKIDTEVLFYDSRKFNPAANLPVGKTAILALRNAVTTYAGNDVLNTIAGSDGKKLYYTNYRYGVTPVDLGKDISYLAARKSDDIVEASFNYSVSIPRSIYNDRSLGTVFIRPSTIKAFPVYMNNSYGIRCTSPQSALQIRSPYITMLRNDMQSYATEGLIAMQTYLIPEENVLYTGDTFIASGSFQDETIYPISAVVIGYALPKVYINQAKILPYANNSIPYTTLGVGPAESITLDCFLAYDRTSKTFHKYDSRNILSDLSGLTPGTNPSAKIYINMEPNIILSL